MRVFSSFLLVNCFVEPVKNVFLQFFYIFLVTNWILFHLVSHPESSEPPGSSAMCIVGSTCIQSRFCPDAAEFLNWIFVFNQNLLFVSFPAPLPSGSRSVFMHALMTIIWCRDVSKYWIQFLIYLETIIFEIFWTTHTHARVSQMTRGIQSWPRRCT